MPVEVWWFGVLEVIWKTLIREMRLEPSFEEGMGFATGWACVSVMLGFVKVVPSCIIGAGWGW